MIAGCGGGGTRTRGGTRAKSTGIYRTGAPVEVAVIWTLPHSVWTPFRTSGVQLSVIRALPPTIRSRRGSDTTRSSQTARRGVC
jgi:hypothetical protein